MKTVSKKLPLGSLRIDYDFNTRARDNYDLGSMDTIIERLRDIPPGVTVLPMGKDEDGKDWYKIVKGNRRIGSAQRLHADPACPSDLKTNLGHVQCVVITEATPEEIQETLYDDGGTMTLSHDEIVANVWRLRREGHSYEKVLRMLYQSFARYTGSFDKAAEYKKACEEGRPEKDRKAILAGWLRGTVADYMWISAVWPEEIRRNIILTEIEKRRPLTPEEYKELTFYCDRQVCAKIRTANAADAKEAKSEGKECPECTGSKYHECVNQLRKDHAYFLEHGKYPASNGADKAMTKKAILDQASLAQGSENLTTLLKNVAGEIPAGPAVAGAREEIMRMETVMKVITTNMDGIKDKELRFLLNTIVLGSPLDLDKLLKEMAKA